MLLLLLASCAARRVESGPVEQDSRIAAGDTLFAARSLHPANLDQAVEAWTTVIAADPTNTDALGRLAHAAWVRHLLDPANARFHLEVGQEFGWTCLLAFPGFGAGTQAGGFHITAATATLLPEEAAACMTWTVANGLRLVELRGPGAALEREPLGIIAAQLRTLSPGGEEGMGFWADGRLMLAQGDPAAARDAFASAVAAAPTYLFFRVEMARAFPDAGTPLTWDATESGPYAAENAAVEEH